MSDASTPPAPRHREKLLDLSTGKTVNTGEGRKEVSATTPAPSAPDETEEPGNSEASVHVSPIGENWEVESEVGTLGQAESKVEAEELAKTLAEEMGAGKVTVHTSEGAVEKEILLRPMLAPDKEGF